MKEKKQSRQELYGTKEVAQILGIPEWRVKNFSEGAAYRLPPAHQVGSGKGSRRLYGWEDIFRMGIADQLVNFGFTPESVGAAVREIPESVLGPYHANLLAHDTVEHGGTRGGLFVLNIANVCDSIFDGLQRHWAGGKSDDL